MRPVTVTLTEGDIRLLLQALGIYGQETDDEDGVLVARKLRVALDAWMGR